MRAEPKHLPEGPVPQHCCLGAKFLTHELLDTHSDYRRWQPWSGGYQAPFREGLCVVSPDNSVQLPHERPQPQLLQGSELCLATLSVAEVDLTESRWPSVLCLWVFSKVTGSKHLPTAHTHCSLWEKQGFALTICG
jgi:hypothetical protein